ncbi:MAG: oligosaccharide flippase family protein [Thermodesulfobacteriota bacterium]
MTLNIKKDTKFKSSVNLIAVQFGLYFIPLVTIPYIVKTVGIENYGKYVFFQAVIGFLAVIINYGFIQTGVRDISVCKTLREINSEYSSILYSKLLGTTVAAAIGALLFLHPKFRGEYLLYSLSFFSLLVFFLDTTFVYQGIEKLKDYVNISMVGNVAVLVLLFAVVRRPEDYIYLPLVFAGPRIAAYLAAVYLLFRRFRILPDTFSIRAIGGKLRSNFNIFATNISAILYTRATQIMLGLMAGNEYVGYYAIADQLVFAYSNIQGKISTVYQPQIAQGFKDDFKAGVVKARENIYIISLVAIAGFLFTQFFAYDLLFVLFGENASHSATILRLLSLNFITMHLSYVLAMQVLLSLYKDRDILKPSIYAAVMNLTLGSVLIYYFRHTGAAVSVTFIEVLVFFYFYAKVKSIGIRLFDRELVQRLVEYTLSLVLALVILRFAYSGLPYGIYARLPAVIVLYGVSVLLSLRIFRMVDFKNRKITLGHAVINE